MHLNCKVEGANMDVFLVLLSDGLSLLRHHPEVDLARAPTGDMVFEKQHREIPYIAVGSANKHCPDSLDEQIISFRENSGRIARMLL